jgi:hypothetical protein
MELSQGGPGAPHVAAYQRVLIDERQTSRGRDR